MKTENICITTLPSRSYAVTAPHSCFIYAPDGTVVIKVKKNKQAYFVSLWPYVLCDCGEVEVKRFCAPDFKILTID